MYSDAARLTATIDVLEDRIRRYEQIISNINGTKEVNRTSESVQRRIKENTHHIEHLKHVLEIARRRGEGVDDMGRTRAETEALLVQAKMRNLKQLEKDFLASHGVSYTEVIAHMESD